MHTEFLAPSNPLWQAFLGSVTYDFYHLPGYVELSARYEGGKPTAFLAEEDGAGMFVPLVLRDIPGTPWRDVLSPYGYSTPLFRGEPSPDQIEAFLRAFGMAGAREGIVTSFFRLHPLLGVPSDPFERVGTLVDHGETIFLDLERPLEELDRQTRASHRAVARQLLAKGFRVEVDGWERMPDFVRIYRETMGRLAADGCYCFDASYFNDLKECLGHWVHLGMVMDPTGAAAAGGIFTIIKGLMQFHLAANATEFLRESPAKLLVMHMRDYGKSQGVKTFHIGGGVGCTDDSLAYFKRGFSTDRSRFKTFRMVLMPEVYRELAGDAAVDGYFPAYRRAGEDRPVGDPMPCPLSGPDPALPSSRDVA